MSTQPLRANSFPNLMSSISKALVGSTNSATKPKTLTKPIAGTPLANSALSQSLSQSRPAITRANDPYCNCGNKSSDNLSNSLFGLVQSLVNTVKSLLDVVSKVVSQFSPSAAANASPGTSAAGIAADQGAITGAQDADLAASGSAVDDIENVLGDITGDVSTSSAASDAAEREVEENSRKDKGSFITRLRKNPYVKAGLKIFNVVFPGAGQFFKDLVPKAFSFFGKFF